MRVAVYCNCDDGRGGILSYTLSLSNALRELGVHVTVVTHEPQRAIAEVVAADLESCADLVLRLPAESDLGRDAQLLASAVMKAKADIFIPNNQLIPHAGAAICSRRSSIRSIGICHNDHSSYYNLLHRYESCLSRFVCASVKTSTQLGAQMPWRVADVATIPHGVQISQQPCVPFTGGELRLIYHGRLVEEQKRVSLLLEIARRLSAAGVPFHLTLIGDGSARQECQLAANEPSLQGRISIHRSQDWATLWPHLIRSHVEVLTSEYEGFCFSLAESMGAGLPAVAFRCGGVIEQFLVHDSTGLLVDSGAIDDFVRAVARLQADVALWSRLSANARAAICRDYPWSRAAKSYLDLFEDVLRHAVRPRWPLGRPIWIAPGKRTLRSIIERVGKDVGLWR